MNGFKKKRPLVIVIAFTMLFSILATSFVCAEPINTTIYSDDNVDVTRFVSNNKVMLNEEITITYTITPKDIAVEKKPVPEKEIMILFDTSSSMRNDDSDDSTDFSRLDAAKYAAQNFLSHLSSIEAAHPGKLKAGLITFNEIAYLQGFGDDGSVFTDDFTEINEMIQNIDTYKEETEVVTKQVKKGFKTVTVTETITKKIPLGPTVSQGTNIGDALRVAYHELIGGNSNANAEKCIVLLSDGQASWFSANLVNGNYEFFTGTGISTCGVEEYWGQHGDKRYEYCNKIAEIIKAYNDKEENTKKFTTYMIAYADADYAFLQGVTQKAGSDISNAKKASSASELNESFKAIGEAITKNYLIQDIDFSETIPDGFELPVSIEDLNIDGKTITNLIKTIQYQLNEAGTHYVAAPISFSYKLKCVTKGKHTFGAAQLKFKDINDVLINPTIDPFDIDVDTVKAPIAVNRTFSTTDTLIDSPVISTYTIAPGEFTVDATLYEGDLPDTFEITNVKLQEKLPAGISVTTATLPAGFSIDADNNLTVDIGKITYTKNAGKYIASDIVYTGIEFIPTAVPTADDAYTFNGTLKYIDLDKEENTKPFTGGPLKVSEYGSPTIVIESITKKGDKVDIKVKYTLPSFTANATIVKNGDGLTPVSLPLTNGYSTFYDLSIYEDHTAIITATSTTGVTRPVELLIYEAINVN